MTESIDDVKFQDAVASEGKHQNLLARQTELGAGEGATHAILRQSWTGWLETVFTDIQFSVN